MSYSFRVEPKLRETRVPGLKYFQWGDYWSFADSDGAPIGPHYKTKAELLADVHRFAEERGFPV